jgi:hypothetical protein
MEEETMKVFVGAVLGAIALWDCLMYYCLMKADAETLVPGTLKIL